MELVYSTQTSGFDAGKRYRNPQHFERPELGVTRVLVIGDWPRVVAAHEAVGVDVEVVDAPRVAIAGAGGIDLHIVEALRRDLEAVGVLVVSLPSGDLLKPEEGETALRLFDALTEVSVSIQALVAERDGLRLKNDELATENGRLAGELQELKDAAKPDDSDEVRALKAKLDAAGTSYRSNASKESLEKLVAELPNA